MEVQIHGYELTLRLEEADQIEIDPIVERSRSHKGAEYMRTFEHPGLGEEVNIIPKKMNIHFQREHN